jgi:hypothetical protein
MARIFIDGFESGTWANWDVVGGTPVISSLTGCSGNYCVRFWIAGGNYLWKYISPISTLYAGCLAQFGSGNTRAVRLYDSATVIATIYFDSTNSRLSIYRGDVSTYLSSSLVGSFMINTWYHIQFKYKPDPTNGIFQVKIDDVLAIDYTGNTVTSSQTTVDGFRIEPQNYAYWDDVVLDDADWPGVSKIAGLAIDGAGDTTEWDPSTGSNYQCVDEIPASDTDYVSTNTVDKVDVYSLADLPAEASIIKCVAVQARARKSGDSTPQNIAMVVRPPTGGTNYAGSDQALPTSYLIFQDLWEQNPYTTSAWTPAEVNSMQAGIKSST